MPSHGRAATALARGLALWAVSLALVSALGTAQTRRPTPERREVICGGYAERAVAQAEENRGRDCGLFGPRWADDYQAHYEWCLVAPLEDVRREAESRAQALERCGGPDDPAARCREYADEAVAQERENQRRRCGFTGPRWSLDRDGHYAWCLITQGVATREESEARRRMLEAECAEEPPVDTSFCEQYAEESAEQHAENLRRGCGFSGVEWTSSVEVHLEQCLARSPEAARRALRSRRQALIERCAPETELVRVPPVERLSAELALRRIAEAGLRGERLDEPSGQALGTVLRQEPEAGSLVPVGTVVALWVAAEEPPAPPEPPGPPEPPEPPGPPRPPEPPEPPEPAGPPEPPGPPPDPALPWPWILGTLALLGVAYLLARARSGDDGERRRPGEPPRLVPVPDLGIQELQAERLLKVDLELRPVLDSGTQKLEADGSLISAERRIDR